MEATVPSSNLGPKAHNLGINACHPGPNAHNPSINACHPGANAQNRGPQGPSVPNGKIDVIGCPANRNSGGSPFCNVTGTTFGRHNFAPKRHGDSSSSSLLGETSAELRGPPTCDIGPPAERQKPAATCGTIPEDLQSRSPAHIEAAPTKSGAASPAHRKQAYDVGCPDHQHHLLRYYVIHRILPENRMPAGFKASPTFKAPLPEGHVRKFHCGPCEQALPFRLPYEKSGEDWYDMGKDALNKIKLFYAQSPVKSQVNAHTVPQMPRDATPVNTQVEGAPPSNDEGTATSNADSASQSPRVNYPVKSQVGSIAHNGQGSTLLSSASLGTHKPTETDNADCRNSTADDDAAPALLQPANTPADSSLLAREPTSCRTPQCALCGGAHTVTTCTSYPSAMTRDRRRMELKLCYRCFRQHHSRKCKMKIVNCTFCGKPHNEALCWTRFPKRARTPSQVRTKNLATPPRKQLRSALGDPPLPQKQTSPDKLTKTSAHTPTGSRPQSPEPFSVDATPPQFTFVQPCIFCQSQDHAAFYCTKLTSYHGRKAAVRRHNRCHICCEPAHEQLQCPLFPTHNDESALSVTPPTDTPTADSLDQESTVTLTPARSEPAPACIFCCFTDHAADDCTTFPTHQARKSALLSDGRCLLCTELGHKMPDCPALRTHASFHQSPACVHCRQRGHNKLLCENRYPVPRPPKDSTEQKPPVKSNAPPSRHVGSAHHPTGLQYGPQVYADKVSPQQLPPWANPVAPRPSRTLFRRYRPQRSSRTPSPDTHPWRSSSPAGGSDDDRDGEQRFSANKRSATRSTPSPTRSNDDAEDDHESDESAQIHYSHSNRRRWRTSPTLRADGSSEDEAEEPTTRDERHHRRVVTRRDIRQGRSSSSSGGSDHDRDEERPHIAHRSRGRRRTSPPARANRYSGREYRAHEPAQTEGAHRNHSRWQAPLPLRVGGSSEEGDGDTFSPGGRWRRRLKPTRRSLSPHERAHSGSDSEKGVRFARRQVSRRQHTDETSDDEERRPSDREDFAHSRSLSRPQDHRRLNSPYRDRRSAPTEQSPECFGENEDCRGRLTFRHDCDQEHYSCPSDCMCNACAHEYGPLADPETTYTDHGTEESDSEPDAEETPSGHRPHDYGTEPNCNTSHYRPDHEEQDSDALSESVHSNGGDDSPRHDVYHDDRDGRYEDEHRQHSSRRYQHDTGDGRYDDEPRHSSSRHHYYDDTDGRHEDEPRQSSSRRYHADDSDDDRYECRPRQYSSRRHHHDGSDGRY